jgi:CopG family nickel-responsive transcriptional regulator
MKTDLARFGVAMERVLLDHLDVIAGDRGVTRSEILRDLVRAEVVRTHVTKRVQAFGVLTLVYDHHVRDLTERLTEIQHGLGERVRSTLHIHLDEHRCLEVIVMQGRSDELQGISEKLLATRGVKQGGMEVITRLDPEASTKHAHDHAPKKKRARREI